MTSDETPLVNEDASGLVFRPATRADDAEMRRLNGEAFPANPKTRPEITAWQWWDNPFGETIAHVWERDGLIVGQYVAFRMPANLAGVEGRIAIGVDIAVADDQRGKGLAKPLLDACFGQATDEGTPFYSLPNDLSVGGATRSGWVQVAQLEVRVLPTDPSVLEDRISGAGAGARRLARPVERALGAAAVRLAGLRVRAPTSLSTEVVPDPPVDVDSLWNAVAPAHPWGVARHGGWWRWRYAEHPDRPYTIIAARHARTGELRGLTAVITRDDLGGRFHCLLELLAVDEAAAQALVCAVRDGACGHADGIATTAMPGSRLAHLASAAGLVRVPPRFLPRPVYFGVVPHPTIVPDPSAVAWSTAWGDLDHI